MRANEHLCHPSSSARVLQQFSNLLKLCNECIWPNKNKYEKKYTYRCTIM